MNIFLSMPLIALFSGISFLHFYWGLGGKKWVHLAIPTSPKATETPLFKPRFFETLAVALGILGFAWVIGAKVGVFSTFQLPNSYISNSVLVIAIIFLLRAIGEFRYVGFFKKIKETPFAKMDTLYYSPICLLISLLSFIIYL